MRQYPVHFLVNSQSNFHSGSCGGRYFKKNGDRRYYEKKRRSFAMITSETRSKHLTDDNCKIFRRAWITVAHSSKLPDESAKIQRLSPKKSKSTWKFVLPKMNKMHVQKSPVRNSWKPLLFVMDVKKSTIAGRSGVFMLPVKRSRSTKIFFLKRAPASFWKGSVLQRG